MNIWYCKFVSFKQWGRTLISELLMNPQGWEGEKNSLTYICDMMEAVGREPTVLSRWFEWLPNPP